ncbi:helix-turn-helix domain-containing protein [Streptomyces sp. NPDC059913]|uniref:helix-turn-helix domain-containing protein n=1 Tax=unclassified Streptomyces TaxID=2593676 RepID=UPI0036654FE2
MAESIQALTARLVDLEYRQAPLADLLRCSRLIEQEVGRYAAAAVQDARSRGASWEEVAQAIGVQSETARVRWSTARVQRLLRDRPGASRMPDGGAENVGLPEGRSGQSHHGLALALSHLHRRSGMTVGEAAGEADMSSPYLSRILAGIRVPSWPVVHMLATIFSGAPQELRFLWEAARGVTQPSRRPVPEAAERLHAALRGLYLAAGSPDHDLLAQKATLSVSLIHDVLEGHHIPDWPMVSQLVSSLGARPAAVRPLWEDLHYAFLVSHDIFPSGGFPTDAAAQR